MCGGRSGVVVVAAAVVLREDATEGGRQVANSAHSPVRGDQIRAGGGQMRQVD